MKKTTIKVILIITTLFYQTALAQEKSAEYKKFREEIIQILKDPKNIESEGDFLEVIYTKGAQAKLSNITEELIKSNDENVFDLFYLTEPNNKKRKEELRELFYKKFPKGEIALKNSLRNLLYYKKISDTQSLESAYKTILKEFDVNIDNPIVKSYDDKFLINKIASKFMEEKEEEAFKLIKDTKEKNLLPVTKESLENKVLSILTRPNATKKISEHTIIKLLNASIPSVLNTNNQSEFNDFMQIYAKTNDALGTPEATTKLAMQIEEKNPDIIRNSKYSILVIEPLVKSNNLAKAKSYAINYIHNYGLNANIEQQLKTAFQSINKDEYEQFIAPIGTKFNEAMIGMYKEKLINKPAEDFTLVNGDNQKVSLADLKGKIVILDFWATWCSPCVGSFPGMQLAVDKYKNDKNVVFLFINTKEKANTNYKEKALKLIKDKNYDFNVLFDEEEKVSKLYKVNGIPHKVIIDEKGNIRYEAAGTLPDNNDVFQELNLLIEIIKQEK